MAIACPTRRLRFHMHLQFPETIGSVSTGHTPVTDPKKHVAYKSYRARWVNHRSCDYSIPVRYWNYYPYLTTSKYQSRSFSSVSI